MAITLPEGFKITSNNAIDSRLVLSKEEMATIKIAAMPEVYICVCSDDRKLYIFDSQASKDPNTGRFRPLEDYLTYDSVKANENLVAALANSSLLGEEIARQLGEDSLCVDGGDLDEEVS